jgi:hypothetical protein
MIKVLGTQGVTFCMILIEWAPKNWSDRSAWGPEAVDGFYLTMNGEVYRLVRNTVIYVTEEPFMH